MNCRASDHSAHRGIHCSSPGFSAGTSHMPMGPVARLPLCDSGAICTWMTTPPGPRQQPATGSWRCLSGSSSTAAQHPHSCGSTTGRSSSPTPWPTGVAPTVGVRCSSTRARHGRTLGIESFNGRLRDELLSLWRFDSRLEARVIVEDWRIDYNTNRPHTAHGDQTPAEFAAV